VRGEAPVLLGQLTDLDTQGYQNGVRFLQVGNCQGRFLRHTAACFAVTCIFLTSSCSADMILVGGASPTARRRASAGPDASHAVTSRTMHYYACADPRVLPYACKPSTMYIGYTALPHSVKAHLYVEAVHKLLALEAHAGGRLPVRLAPVQAPLASASDDELKRGSWHRTRA